MVQLDEATQMYTCVDMVETKKCFDIKMLKSPTVNSALYMLKHFYNEGSGLKWGESLHRSAKIAEMS